MPRIRRVFPADDDHRIDLPRQLLHLGLILLGGVADRVEDLDLFANLKRPYNDLRKACEGLRRLREESQPFFGEPVEKLLDLGKRFCDEDFAPRVTDHRLGLRMIGITDHHHLIALIDQLFGISLRIGDEGTGGVNHLQPGLFGIVHQLGRSDPVRPEDDRAARLDIRQRRYGFHPHLRHPLDDLRVVNERPKAMDVTGMRCCGVKRHLHRTLHPKTKPTLLRNDHFHDHTLPFLFPCTLPPCGHELLPFPLFPIEQVEDGLNFCTICKTGVAFALVEVLGRFVSPAPLRHEGIPDQDFLVIGLTAMLKTPLKDFFICPTPQGSIADVRISHLQKAAAASIEPNAEIFVVIVRKLPCRHQSDFLEHPGKVNEATDLGVGAARGCHVEVTSGIDQSMPFGIGDRIAEFLCRIQP